MHQEMQREMVVNGGRLNAMLEFSREPGTRIRVIITAVDQIGIAIESRSSDYPSGFYTWAAIHSITDYR